MSNIATLAVQLTAVTAPFTKGMKGAASSVNSLQTASARTNSVLLQMSSSLAGFFSVAAIGGTVMSKLRESARALEEINDSSAMLGASVENLNAMRFAAGAMGTQLDKMTGAVSKLVMRLGDSGAAKAFTQLGLDPAKLRATDSVRAFEQVAGAINKLPTAADRAKAMNDIFGKSWRDVAEVVLDGGKSIDEAREHLRALGIEISDADAKGVDKSNTAWRKFTGTISAFSDKTMATLAPHLEMVANGAKTWTGFGIKGVQASYKLTRSIFPWVRIFEDAGNAVRENNALMDDAAGKTNTWASALDSLADAEKRQAETLKGFDKAMKSLADLGRKGREITRSVMTPLEQYGERVNDAFSLLNRGIISGQTFDRYLEKSRTELFPKADKMKKNAMDALSTSSVETVGLSGAMNYLRNVARGTQINGAMMTGPAEAGKAQEVSDPQLSETNKYLAQIMDNTETMYAVAG